MLQFRWYKFYELSLDELYALLAVRAEVFVVEQNCFYLDPDDKDQEAIHLLGMENNKLVTYLRLFPPTKTKNELKFGRVLTTKSVRTKGYGKKLIQEMLNFCGQNFPHTNVDCSAQLYLQKFYEDFGFKAYGESYDEANIPHIAMKKVVK